MGQSDLFTKFRQNRLRLLTPFILRGFFAAVLGVSMIATLYGALGFHQNQSKTRYFIMFILMLVLFFIAYRRFHLFVIHFIQENVAEIRLNIMRRVSNIGLLDYEKIGYEKVYLALIYDERFVSEISQYAASFLLSICGVITAHICLLYFSLPAGIVSIIVYGTVCVIYGFNQVKITEILEEVRYGEKIFLQSVRDLFDGFKELRLNNKKSDDFFHRALIEHTSLLKKQRIRYQNIFMNNYSMAYGLFKSLLMLMVLLIPLFGIATGNLVFTLLGFLFFMPYSVLIDRVPGIILAYLSLKRLFELHRALENLNHETIAQPPEAIDFKQLRFKNIKFSYGKRDSFNIGPLDMTINKGEIIFITGSNGSGKSTLLKLITGLYPLQSGQVLLNRSEIQMNDYRHLFSVIHSDYHLFMYLYGMDKIDHEQTEALIEIMQLKGKVRLDGNKFNTLKLSSGQKKRLALISVLLENKPLYVFDEWAADQDPCFRQYFYESLVPSFKEQNKTVIVVTHDDRYLHIADRTIKLEYGKVC